MQDAIRKVVGGSSLSEEEMVAVMTQIMEGRATDAQIGALLVALRMKGESSEEIAGAARVMREKALPLSTPEGKVVDTCGTGGDHSGSFNISTTVAFVVSAAGAIVAKHGNHSNTSASGSADVLKALGFNLACSRETVEDGLRQIGIGFLYAPSYHQAMKHAVGPRKEIGIRSLFNLLGPLSNPARASYQLIGVYDAALIPVMLPALQGLGLKGAMVVHGEDGLDEFTLCGQTFVGELKDGTLRYAAVRPEDFGLASASWDDLKGGSPEENAAITRAILNGEPGPRRDIVLLNAGAALSVAGLASDIGGGIALAAEAIDSGKARTKLEQLIRLSHGKEILHA